MRCEHKRLRFDNTGNEQRIQCLDCNSFGCLNFKKFDDMQPKDAFLTNMKFTPYLMFANSTLSP